MFCGTTVVCEVMNAGITHARPTAHKLQCAPVNAPSTRDVCTLVSRAVLSSDPVMTVAPSGCAAKHVMAAA